MKGPFADCFSLLDVPARRRLVVLVALVFVNTVLEVASVGMILPFIALLERPDVVEQNAIARIVSEALDLRSTSDLLTLTGIALLFLVLFKNAYLYLVIRMQYRFALGEAAKVSTRLFKRYLHGPYSAHLDRNSADLITTADYSVDNTFVSGVMSILIMATEFAAVLGIVVFMLIVEPGPTLTLIGILALCAVILARVAHTWLVALGERGLVLRMARLRTISQALSAIKELKTFGREAFFTKEF